MARKPEQELLAVLQAQAGNPTRLRELLEPLRRPLLSLFICRALEGKSLVKFTHRDFIGSLVQMAMAKRPREKKIIVAEVAKQVTRSENYVRHCHKHVLKVGKPFEEALKEVQECTNPKTGSVTLNPKI